MKNLIPLRSTFVLLLLAFLVVGTACRLDVFRLREGRLVESQEFDDLNVDTTTLEETLDTLGAPDRVEWKNGDDFLWYDYADEIDVGLRFRIPSTVFGYQHTFLRLSEASEHLNTVQLVFDEEHVLRHKSLRLDEEYEEEPKRSTSSKFHIIPRFEHSLLLLGDAGVDDFDEVFENGFRAGVDFGIQPVPAFTFLIGGSYQEYEGESFVDGGRRIEADDLQLFQFEVGVRLVTPLSIIADLGNFDEVKRVLFGEDLDQARGWQYYLQGTTGVTFNPNISVKIDGARGGTLYDDDLLFSGTVGSGIEYTWKSCAVHLGVTYATVDPFNEGNSDVDGDSSSFRSFLVGGGLSLKF